MKHRTPNAVCRLEVSVLVLACTFWTAAGVRAETGVPEDLTHVRMFPLPVPENHIAASYIGSGG